MFLVPFGPIWTPFGLKFFDISGGDLQKKKLAFLTTGSVSGHLREHFEYRHPYVTPYDTQDTNFGPKQTPKTACPAPTALGCGLSTPTR